MVGQAALFAALRDPLDGALDEVANDGDVVLLPASGGLLIDAKAADLAGFLACEASGHGAMHQVPGFVPTNPQDLPGGLDAGLLEHLDGEGLEHHREPRMELSPRQAYPADPVLRALHPRRFCMQERLELAASQVAPAALGRVIM